MAKGTKKGTARRGRKPVHARRRSARSSPPRSDPDNNDEVRSIVAAAGEPDGYRDLIAPFRVSVPLTPSAAISWLPYFEVRYNETKNPIFVWEAFGVAINSGAPVPEWVTGYLCRVSEQIHAMSRTNIPDKAIPSAVYRALEFVSAKKTNPFRSIMDASHDFGIALDVLMHIRDGKKPEFAIIDVAREHPSKCERSPKCETLSPSSVGRIWRQHRRRLK